MRTIWVLVATSTLVLGLVATIFLGQSALFPSEPLQTLDTKSLPQIGNKRAPHEIIVVIDYSCFACTRFHANILPEIVDTYVRTGRAQLRITTFPVKPGATEIARAVYCEGEKPGTNWLKLLDKIYALHLEQTDRSSIADAVLGSTANSRDKEVLLQCMNSNSTAEEIERRRYAVLMRGITSVPTVIVDRVKLTDAWDLRAYAEAMSRNPAIRKIHD